MAKLTEILSRIRIVRRRSSTLTKVTVLCAIVLSMAALLALGSAITDARTQAQAAADQAARLEQENDQLEDKIDSLGSVEGMEQIAEEELGLVPTGSVIFDSGN